MDATASFRRAICDKPGANGLPSAEAVGVEFAKANGIAGEDAAALAALRALPADKIVAGLNMASMMTPTYAGPMIDGTIVVESNETALKAGRFAKVPVIVGANSADIGFSFARSMDEVFAPFGANADKAKARPTIRRRPTRCVKWERSSRWTG